MGVGAAAGGGGVGIVARAPEGGPLEITEDFGAPGLPAPPTGRGGSVIRIVSLRMSVGCGPPTGIVSRARRVDEGSGGGGGGGFDICASKLLS